MRSARKLATTTFLNSPAAMSQKAGPTSTLRGSGRTSSWGRNSLARTIGPATIWGKNARYTPKSSVEGGASFPRPTSMT